MAVQDPTAANVSLWARFLEDEWGNADGPGGPRNHVARAVAAAVAGWLTIAVAPRIARMYDDNLPHINGFIEPARAQPPGGPAVPMEFQDNRAMAEPAEPAPARARAAVPREVATIGRG